MLGAVVRPPSHLSTGFTVTVPPALRRFTATVALGLLSATLLLSVPTTAQAVVSAPPPPIEELRSLPSQVGRVTSAGGIGDSNIRAMAWLYGQIKQGISSPTPGAPTTPSTALDVKNLRPLTKPTPFVRPTAAGSAGPLIGGFVGGFALGTQGLEIYGAITGEDPFESLCGTPFEGYGSVVYFGYMPDCKALIRDPNIDIVPGTTWKLATGTFTPAGSGSNARICGPKTMLPTGHSYVGRFADNSVTTFLWGNVGVCGTTTGYYVSNYWSSGTRTIQRIEHWDQKSGVVDSSAAITSTPDPTRKPDCSILWGDGTTTKGTGTPYQDSTGYRMTATDTGCKQAWDAKPGGGIEHLPKKISIGSTPDGGSRTEIATQDVPEYTEQQKKSLLAPSITEGLKLWQGDNTCMTWKVDCASWWPDTSNGTQAGPKEYRCTFNKQPVDLSECGVYRETFDTRTENPTITDPQTGEKVEAVTKPEQGNSINPGTGPGTSPGEQCMSEWGAAPNPIDWVLHPIKCALVWAFVPREAVIRGSIGSVGAAVGAPVSVAPIIGLIGSLPANSGCNGIPLNLDLFGTQVRERLLNACAPPWSTVATVTNAAITLTVGTMVVLSIARFAAAAFGFVGPGGSFDNARYTEASKEAINSRLSRGSGS